VHFAVRGSRLDNLACADDLAILGNSWEDVSQKYARWKEALESRGLKVIIKKTTKAMKVPVKLTKGSECRQ